MSFSMKLISMNRIGPVLRYTWYAIFINIQISLQICKLMVINKSISLDYFCSKLTTVLSLSIKIRSMNRIRNFLK